MRIFTVIISLFFLNSFAQNNEKSKAEVCFLLDNWHKAAAEANFDAYFNAMDEKCVFIGTDATENWDKQEFQAYAKPYFDKGKAWNFIALERTIYFDKSGKIAWFDELLDTQMKICRGSGVLIKVGKEWKIKHYVLSMTIPNENTNEVIKLKEIIENPIIDKLKK
uniref:nuclear transport factor 2 family protein n=1 Tax=Flavobacterium sp. TaxID=239 RepID=UPI00404B32A4